MNGWVGGWVVGWLDGWNIYMISRQMAKLKMKDTYGWSYKETETDGRKKHNIKNKMTAEQRSTYK